MWFGALNRISRDGRASGELMPDIHTSDHSWYDCPRCAVSWIQNYRFDPGYGDSLEWYVRYRSEVSDGREWREEVMATLARNGWSNG